MPPRRASTSPSTVERMANRMSSPDQSPARLVDALVASTEAVVQALESGAADLEAALDAREEAILALSRALEPISSELQEQIRSASLRGLAAKVRLQDHREELLRELTSNQESLLRIQQFAQSEEKGNIFTLEA